MGAGVLEKDGFYLLYNDAFEIKINPESAAMEEWLIKTKQISLLNKPSCVDLIDSKPVKPYYLTSTTTSITFEYQTHFGLIKKVYSIDHIRLIVDIYLISSSAVKLSYCTQLNIEPQNLSIFMVGKEEFNIEKQSIEAEDLLLINKPKDMYLGFIFKEKAHLNIIPSDSLQFSLTTDVSLLPNDMFMISYTSSLV
ncbi:hypothetical protein [Hippea sp. KM1]|uniref:hypothetical protein n=1 Tax=Hippea sp. KM1 TaxID=944481 RepID=UPI00046CBD5E|nr:hypothetical protein [Hippea sp. KM1]